VYFVSYPQVSCFPDDLDPACLGLPSHLPFVNRDLAVLFPSCSFCVFFYFTCDPLEFLLTSVFLETSKRRFPNGYWVPPPGKSSSPVALTHTGIPLQPTFSLLASAKTSNYHPRHGCPHSFLQSRAKNDSREPFLLENPTSSQSLCLRTHPVPRHGQSCCSPLLYSWYHCYLGFSPLLWRPD